jgi:hypothetical protein
MDCPYCTNSFSSVLTPELKKILCDSCTKIRYPAGNIFNWYNWNDTFTVLVDGFIISADPDANSEGAFVPLELLGSGNFLATPQSWTSVRWKNVPSFVILDSVIAIFDRRRVEDLYKNNIDFVRAVCEGYMVQYNEMAMAFQEIGGKDARAAVKHVLNFCRNHGIPQLTHAQIALAAGLTRPTVTKTIHELLKTEPELFQPKAKDAASVQQKDPSA